MDNNAPLNPHLDQETAEVIYEAIHPERPQHSAGSNTTATHYDEKNIHDGGVNISQAEADFAELNRELSRASHISRRSSRIHKAGATADIEKSGGSDVSSEEPFDLERVLRGNRDEEEAAGIKSKHIGVVWEGLTVSGIGGVKNYIKTFPDAFVSFFNVFETAMNVMGIGKKGKEFDILKDFKGVTKPGEMVLVLGR
jgi:hypothetical protein